MAEGSYKRKLAAILSADVVGYSRLMGEDEAATVRTLEVYKGVMSELIRQHRGRVVDSPGDNILAEFASVVDAVQCAVAVQKELQARDAEMTENRRMRFRIGINLGDVIEEEGRIYGDGVNIAARLEALADPGGICVSKTAFDHIETKLPLGYEFLGEQEVKNIAKPVGAYRVLMEPRITIRAEAGVKGEAEAKAEAEKAARRRAQGKRRRHIVAGVVGALMVLVGGAALWEFAFRPPLPPQPPAAQPPPQPSPSPVATPPSPPVEKADPTKMAFPLPDKPSIAVLPFANMGDDPQQAYFGDGLAEEIINALAKLSQIFVIARNSSFTYKGKTVDVKQVGRELGVKYVLEGSVRRDAQRVRVTAQLIETATGNHLFSERYDRELKDIFATQDEITIAIVRALRVTITSGEQARLIGRGTKNLDAYLKAIQANEQFMLMNRQGSVRAKELAMEAIALDPGYAYPHAILANAHMLDVWFRFSESPDESMRLAGEAAHTALALEKADPYVLSAMANVCVMQRQYERGIASAERALEISPGSARSQGSMAWALMFACRFQEAIPFYEEALRLDPYPSGPEFRGLASAYAAVGRHDDALGALQKALRATPTDIFTHLGLAMAYVELGREEEARAAAKEVLRLHPKFSLEDFAKIFVAFKDPAFVDRRLELLRRAGLK
jgi:adenylate cyclase